MVFAFDVAPDAEIEFIQRCDLLQVEAVDQVCPERPPISLNLALGKGHQLRSIRQNRNNFSQ